MNRQMKRMMQRQGQLGPDGSPSAVRRPTQSRPSARAAAQQRTSPLNFLREVRAELRKVAWPTRGEVVNYSSVVLVTLVVLIALIFVLDLAFAKSVLLIFET